MAVVAVRFGRGRIASIAHHHTVGIQPKPADILDPVVAHNMARVRLLEPDAGDPSSTQRALPDLNRSGILEIYHPLRGRLG